MGVLLRFCHAKSRRSILRWASIDEDELELLNARRRSADWVRKVVNATPEDMYPEKLADEAVFLVCHCRRCPFS